MRVCVPSQTISVMTTTGKSALRRKRFTRASTRRVPAVLGSTRPPGRLRDGVRVENRHVGQIPVPLAVVEAVSDHELVRNLEARVSHVDVDLAPGGLGQQRADLEGGGVPRL